MKALFLTGENQYGVVSHFLSGMIRDLEHLGVTSQLLSLATQSDIHQTLKAIDRGLEYDFVVSFNGVGLDIGKAEGHAYFEHCGKPVFVFLVDHPLHRLHLLFGTRATVLCVDQEHVGFCQLCGIKAEYFPHAVASDEVKPDQFLPLQDKSDEILFPVSYFDAAHWRERLEPIWGQIGPLVERVNNVTRFLQLLGVLPLGERPASVPLDKNVLKISRIVDYYYRASARTACLHKCAEQSIKLTVLGNNAMKFAEVCPFHDYQDAVPFRQLLQRMASSRYVLHNSPGFERGLHERIVVPMSLGTPVIALDTPFIKQSFEQTCWFPELDSLAGISDGDYAEAQRENAKAIAAANTWKLRLTELLTRQKLLVR